MTERTHGWLIHLLGENAPSLHAAYVAARLVGVRKTRISPGESGARYVADLDSCRNTLGCVRTTIVGRIRPRLQAALRAHEVAQIRDPDACLDSRTTKLIASALAALAEIEEMTSRDVAGPLSLAECGTPGAKRTATERQLRMLPGACAADGDAP